MGQPRGRLRYILFWDRTHNLRQVALDPSTGPRTGPLIETLEATISIAYGYM